MNDSQCMEAIERELKSSIGLLGEFIVHKQLKKMHRSKTTVAVQDLPELIDLIVAELMPLTGPKKAKELEGRLRELSIEERFAPIGMGFNGGFLNM